MPRASCEGFARILTRLRYERADRSLRTDPWSSPESSTFSRELSIERNTINPWRWQDQFGFSQALEVTGGQRVLYCAGQTAVDAEGRSQHIGDMRAQLALALDNLETVLKTAGYALGDIVRLNYYTTDVDQLLQHSGVLAERLGAAGCQPSSTLLGVSRLATPDLLVEIEATAVR